MMKFEVDVSLDDLVKEIPSWYNHDAIFEFIVGLERECESGDLLERLYEHFKEGVEKEDGGESETLYLLRGSETRVTTKCGREFEMDCDEHDTCEFRQRLRKEIERREKDGDE